MKLDVEGERITVDSAELAPLLDLAPGDLRQRMQEGRIGILSETGEGEDAGRFRVTFRAERWQVRLTCAEDGTVLSRVRAKVRA